MMLTQDTGYILSAQQLSNYLWQVTLDGVGLDHVPDSAGPLSPWKHWVKFGDTSSIVSSQ